MRSVAFHGGRRGFTLVEVIVALVVASEVVVALLVMHAGACRTRLEARALEEATLAGRSIVEQLRLGLLDPQEGENRPVEDSPDLSWRSRTEKLSSILPDLEVERLEVVVTYPTLTGKKSVCFYDLVCSAPQ